MNDEPTPGVTVVIPTVDRPGFVRSAVDAVVAQDYRGHVDVLVVHDGTEPDASLERDVVGRSVRVLRNLRTPGLAGARNTGILASSHGLIAFCDDDDTWLAGKLTAQVRTLVERSDSELCSCDIIVDFAGHSTVRCAGSATVTHAQLTASRMAMLHSSTFLLRRTALIDGLGLVDERIPGSQNEDWDLLLRAARRGPIAVVEQPLVKVRWGRTSFYARDWDTKVASLEWMLKHHPEIALHGVGGARVFGQVAFAHACAGRRRAALVWVAKALWRRQRPEWRAVAAALVALRVVRGETLLDRLHRFGRGV